MRVKRFIASVRLRTRLRWALAVFGLFLWLGFPRQTGFSLDVVLHSSTLALESDNSIIATGSRGWDLSGERSTRE